MRRLIFGLCLLAACSDDDETASTMDGGSLDAGIAVPDDAGQDASLDAQLDASLCSKYGGAAEVERAIKQHVLVELATDCRVGLHFMMLPASRLARFADCLTFQAQELFGCPGVRYEGSKSPNGLPCRDMKSAHAGLGLSTGDFDAMLTDVAAGLLKAGLAQSDIAQLAPALIGLQSQIVESPVDVLSQSCDSDAGAPDAGG